MRTPSRRFLLTSIPIATVGATFAAAPSARAETTLRLGAFSPTTTMADFDGLIGRETYFQSFFVGRYDTVWPTPDDGRSGIYALYLDPFSMDAATRYAWWSSGSGDDWIKTFADRAAQVPGTVYIRPWAEMNADWQYNSADWPGGAASAGNSWGDPDDFVAAWQRVVSRMRSLHPNKFRFIFCPTTDTYEQTVPVSRLWPGADYVDFHGLDGFNWAVKYGGWRSFDDIYATQWANLQQLSAKSVIICEVSSGEAEGYSKGQWWRDMFTSLGTDYYAQAYAACFFSEDKRSTAEGTDWRITSSQDSLDGLREILREVEVVAERVIEVTEEVVQGEGGGKVERSASGRGRTKPHPHDPRYPHSETPGSHGKGRGKNRGGGQG